MESPSNAESFSMEHNQLSIENFVEFIQAQQQQQDENGTVPILPEQTANEPQYDQHDERWIENAATQRNSLTMEEHRMHSDLVAENLLLVNTRVLFDRNETSVLVEKHKILNKNALTNNVKVCTYIQDYEEIPPSSERQEDHLLGLVSCQKEKVNDLISNYPFSIALSKRLLFVSSVLESLSKKFHCLKHIPNEKTKECGTKISRKSIQPASAQSGTDVLMQMGIKTGISLLFSLMRQSWQQSTNFDLCNDILNTASSVILSLPPLSLANEAKLPKLAKESLTQVMKFLSEIVGAKFSADQEGRNICADVLLGLSLQQGSLSSILEWIEVAVVSALSGKTVYVPVENLNFWLLQIKTSRVCMA